MEYNKKSISLICSFKAAGRKEIAIERKNIKGR